LIYPAALCEMQIRTGRKSLDHRMEGMGHDIFSFLALGN
jgi:hypothetical protein